MSINPDHPDLSEPTTTDTGEILKEVVETFDSFADYYEAKGWPGISPEESQRLSAMLTPIANPVFEIRPMNTFPDPTPTDDIASRLAVNVSTNPNNYTPGVRSLAKAYEHQRERIADLEEDVERLRPKEAFVPEVLFEYDDVGDEIKIETGRTGGLIVFATNPNGDGPYLKLDKDTSTRLTTALNKWAGLDGVEWKPVGACCGPAGMSVLMTDGKRVDVGTIEFAGHYEWPYGNTPTHYIPLPKPPVVKS